MRNTLGALALSGLVLWWCASLEDTSKVYSSAVDNTLSGCRLWTDNSVTVFEKGEIIRVNPPVNWKIDETWCKIQWLLWIDTRFNY